MALGVSLITNNKQGEAYSCQRSKLVDFESTIGLTEMLWIKVSLMLLFISIYMKFIKTQLMPFFLILWGDIVYIFYTNAWIYLMLHSCTNIKYVDTGMIVHPHNLIDHVQIWGVWHIAGGGGGEHKRRNEREAIDTRARRGGWILFIIFS